MAAAASNHNNSTMPPTTTTTTKWGEDETLALLRFWSDSDVQRKLKFTYHNKDLWDHIAAQLAVVGYFRTGFQCKVKVGMLRKECHKFHARGGIGTQRRRPGSQKSPSFGKFVSIIEAVEGRNRFVHSDQMQLLKRHGFLSEFGHAGIGAAPLLSAESGTSEKMKILLLLTVLACCYQLSFIKTPKLYKTNWTSACHDGNKFIWNPKADFEINGSLFPQIEHIPISTAHSVKRCSIVHALHAAALRLLLIIAGDVEQNPGPIDSQPIKQSMPTNQSESSNQPELPSTHQSDLRMKCPHCPESFAWKSDLNRHMRSKHEGQKFSCSSCSFQTGRKDNLKRHMDSFHGEGSSKQPRIQNLATHRDAAVAINVNTPSIADPSAGSSAMVAIASKIQPKKTALKGELKTFQLPADEGVRDLELFLNSKVQEIEESIKQELSGRTGIKLMLNPRIEFFKPVHPEETTTNYFSHKPIQIFRGSRIANEIQMAFPPILKAIEQFTREGSGWAIQNILRVDVHIARLGLTRGSSYHKLPKELANKKAMVNVKNNDNKCFLWSILAKLHPVAKHAQRVTKYAAYVAELDFAGIDFPVKIKDIAKVERKNGLAINLYGYDDEVGLHPLRMSKEVGCRWIHLLLYKDHYSLIKNLDRLMADQRGGKRRKYFCPRCLTPKYTPEDRKAHYEMCCKEEPTKIVMPVDTELKFTNYKKMLRQPLVLYADFECLTEKVDGIRRGNTLPYQKHIPCGYGLVSVTQCCGASKIGTSNIERGADCVKRFFNEIAGYAVEHQQTINEHENYKNIEMSPADWLIHNGNTCHICSEEIVWHPESTDDVKVRDHCHFCGKYRGPAHLRCNRVYRKNRDIVVVLHNLRKYDAHLLMQEIGGAAKLHGWDLDVVAKTMEDYISFSLVHKKEVEECRGADELGDEPDVMDHSYNIRFIDSFQFMNRSLAELVGNLEKDRFHAMGQEFAADQLELLLRKGVYPYDYMDCWDKFDERMFPRKRDFYNQLNDETVSDEDYRHGMEVWKVFDIRTLGQYHDLYLKTDVLLLADVFEQFRRISMGSYGLDPCHYMTAPSLTWDACLKMTEVTLELLRDPDMYMFFEHGIRGGISQISHRYARANNKYIGLDSSKPSSYIMYLDANNLYGYAMVQSMPVNGFKWMEKEEIEEICWSDVPDDWKTGYVLEVDLEYPENLHDAHASYPLAPEHMTITEISPYCQDLREKLGLKTPPTRKLVTTLYDKKKYIIHYRNLKLYQKLGVKVTKVHRVVSFKQAKWMEPYIMSNTQKRTVARNGFEKDFYKLMNNAAFGKTMEDVRKYKNVELVTSDVRHRKLVASPRYRSSTIFTDNLVGVCLLRASTCLNKPIYCGFTVLELSKELMYQFHYYHIIPKYGSKATLLFTDTDSLCYLIETEDVYKDMAENAEDFDFSDYPRDHPLYSTKNKKVIGKMKDELAGVLIIEFLGLRPKMYSIKDTRVEKKTAKGIKKRVVKNVIRHQDYIDTLFEECPMKHDMNFIQSKNHQLESVTITKKSLSPYDDKRWLLDSINSLPYGHYSISGPSFQSPAGDDEHDQ